MTDREQFLEERKGSIGGSDVADLLDLPPYGCERKLYYDKSGVPEDFPGEMDDNLHVRRGNATEGIAIAEFCKVHKYVDLTEAPPPQATLSDHPLVKAHADRILKKVGGVTPIVCETKVPSVERWQDIKDSGEYPEAWNAQLRWTMLAYGLKHGVLNIFNVDRFTPLIFEVRADREMEEQMIAVAEAFWQRIGTGNIELSLDGFFPAKPDDYAGCPRCAWRKTCKGWGRSAALAADQEDLNVAARAWVVDDSLEPTIQRLIEARANAKQWKKDEEELEKFLDTMLAGRDVMTSKGYRAWWQQTVKNFKAQPAKPAVQKAQRSLKVLEP